MNTIFVHRLKYVIDQIILKTNENMNFPETLKNRVWHTTSLQRFQQILIDKAILPKSPTIANSERWKASKGAEFYPFVRVIGGVSLFDFRNFDEKKYSEKYRLSSWSSFVPRQPKWDKVVWIEINTEMVRNNLILGTELVEKWKNQDAYRHSIMPIIEIAHIGALPTTSFIKVLVFSKDKPSFLELKYST